MRDINQVFFDWEVLRGRGFMKLSTILSGLVVIFFSTAAGAVKIPLPPELKDAALNFNVQMQAWNQATENAGPTGLAWDDRIFLRRARLIVSGDFNKQIHFFVNIDAPNTGRSGTSGSVVGLPGNVLLQDLRMVYEPTPGIFITGGFLIEPLSHHLHQSTLSYTTLEIHTATLRFQQGLPPTTTGNSNTAFREPGIEAHGWLFDKRLGFRVGLYNGVRGTPDPLGPLNPDGIPRIAGYVHLNLLESEERGFLYQGVYFSDKPILSIGVGTNYQPKSVRNLSSTTGAPTNGVSDYRGSAADVFLEYPFPGDQAINAQVAFYNYSFGDNHPSTGNGFFADLAYRIGQWQPVVSYEFFSGNSSPAVPDDARIWTAGLNWWINKTTTNLKIEFQHLRRGALTSPSGTPTPGNQNQKIVTLAGQLFF
jgi:hypothetical protein